MTDKEPCDHNLTYGELKAHWRSQESSTYVQACQELEWLEKQSATAKELKNAKLLIEAYERRSA